MSDGGDKDGQRLDVFLFFARFCKTRAVAGALIEKGSVRINRLPTEKPHARVRPDDVLTLALPNRVLVVRVVALAKRRGSAVEARLLYEEIL
jgi:ribosome-associated heat shock protein Hsp15